MIIYKYTAAERAELKALDNDFIRRAEAYKGEAKPGESRLGDLYQEYNEAAAKLYEKIEQRQFNELGGDPKAILKDAKKQIELSIKALYKEALDAKNKGFEAYKDYLLEDRKSVDGYALDASIVRENVEVDLLKYHYAFFEEDQEKTEELSNLVKEVVKNSPLTKDKKEYRTKAKAKAKGAMTKVPTNLSVIIEPSHKYALSYKKEGAAYLTLFENLDNDLYQFKNGKLSLTGKLQSIISEVDLRDLNTLKTIENLDTGALTFYHTLLLEQFIEDNCDIKKLRDEITIPVTTLAQRPTETEIKAAIERLKGFHHIVGLAKEKTPTGKTSIGLYQVLNFHSYDPKTNTVTFSSPYIKYLIETLYEKSILRDENGKPIKDKNGKVSMLPTYTRLPKSGLSKERNKAAAENVLIITSAIAQEEGKTIKISAREIIARNPILELRLENSKNPGQMLNRVFSKTWALLKTQTDLTKQYKELTVGINENEGTLLEELDPIKEPYFIPTANTIEDITYYFKHKGKISI